MSVAEFSAALKTTALKNWFQRLSTDNILKISAKDLRKQESGKEFNSFYITENTISDVIQRLTNTTATKEDVAQVTKKFKEAVYNKTSKGKQIKEPYVEGTAFYYPRISFDSINSVLEQGFSDVLTKVRTTNPDAKISDYFQRGHVFGIFPKKLAEVTKSISSNSTLDDSSKNVLLGVLKDLEAYLKEEDLATSNLKSPKFGLYARYEKKATKYLVELQLKEENEAAGRKQAAISKAIRKYFNPGAVSFTSGGGIRFTEGDAEKLLKDTITNNVEKLVGTKGSPSMVDLIKLSIVDAIQGKQVKERAYSIAHTKVQESKASKIDTKQINSDIKKELAKVQKLIKAVNKVPKISVQPSKTNLSSLLLYINSHLQNVISANMGDGNDKKILNYRTGRFAGSAKVERLLESRAGMLSAFYSYMKNPYGTFEPGFAQGSPASRNPRNLIGTSIREIAATKVANQLRAISV